MTSSTSSDLAARPAMPEAVRCVNTVVLIPAYEPDRRLVELVRSLAAAPATAAMPVVVIDDGSGPAYRAVFESCRALGCEVITHEINRGKGAALKTGFAHVVARHPDAPVVCADCDGQHTPNDIARVAAALADGNRADRADRAPGAVGVSGAVGASDAAAIVLGARGFVGDVPARSRFGNSATRYAFFAATRTCLQDTQTGLRAYPASLLGWLGTIDGDRFDYELTALLAARTAGVPIREVPIDTVYLDGNESSHFDPIRDSVRIYRRLGAFMLSSIASFVLDAVVLFSMMAVTGRLAVSVITARLVSATFNFSVNRSIVFRGGRSRRSSAIRYVALAATLLAANLALMTVLSGLGVPLIVAKVVTELSIFVAGYWVQRQLVFA